VLLPWLLFGAPLADVLTAEALLKALWPVLGGVALAAALGWAGDRVPEVPGGDIIVPGRHALRLAAPLGPLLGRMETALRAWPTAGMALLTLIAALGLAMGAGP
jgi:hypothetical protein